MEEDTSTNENDGLLRPARKETGLDDWLLTGEAFNMCHHIYTQLLYSIATFLMAAKANPDTVGWADLSNEQAKELGVTEYCVNKYDQKWSAEDPEGHWNDAYDINAKLEELYHKGYNIKNHGEVDHPDYQEGSYVDYDAAFADWYLETVPFVRFLWI